MPRKSTKEYIALKRSCYQGSSPDEKTKIIDDNLSDSIACPHVFAPVTNCIIVSRTYAAPNRFAICCFMGKVYPGSCFYSLQRSSFTLVMSPSSLWDTTFTSRAK